MDTQGEITFATVNQIIGKTGKHPFFDHCVSSCGSVSFASRVAPVSHAEVLIVCL